MRAWGAVLFVGILTACTIGPGADDPKGHDAGEPCATDADCKTRICNTLGGYCGQNGCSAKSLCPSGWACLSSNDILSDFFDSGPSTYCEAPCTSCPNGTTCDPVGYCHRPDPIVTTSGVAKSNTPATVTLAIDGHGRSITASDVKWSITSPFSGSQAIPSSGTGLTIDATFPVAGTWGVHLQITGGGLPEADVDTTFNVCSDIGTACTQTGSCCGGECADQLCVGDCTASCAPGFSCHTFDDAHHFSDAYPRPNGSFCYPDLPVITITADPPVAGPDATITFTATVTSPAGLAITNSEWLSDYGLTLGTGLTLQQSAPAFDHAITVKLRATDSSQQYVDKEITVPVNQP